MHKKKKLKPYWTVLDIGTSKVCCLIVRIGVDERPEIIGVGYAPANGIKAGAIVDLDKATECISNVLSQAEKQAGRQIEKIIVNVSSTQLKSTHLYQETDIPEGRQITGTDVKKLVDHVLSTCIGPDEELIHAFPLNYVVDKEIVQDPRGLYGRKLGVHMHFITILENQMRNLMAVLDRCHVQIEMKAATPYASALAVISEEEKELGACVIDMGAGTTSFALFLGGGLVHQGLIPNGGNSVTRDIAQGLSTSLSSAERLKTLNGAAFLSPKDHLERLIVPVLGEEAETTIQIPRSDLISIIIPRLEEILEQIGQKLEQEGRFLIATRRLILTGGGSELEGIKEKTALDLKASVRIGKIEQIKGLPAQFDAYTFSACIGLLKYAMIKQKNFPIETVPSSSAPKSVFRKVVRWLIRNF